MLDSKGLQFSPIDALNKLGQTFFGHNTVNLRAVPCVVP
jgi:hypothetical protein